MQTLTFSYRLKRWPLLLSLPPAAGMAFLAYERVTGSPGSVNLLSFIELRGEAASAFHLLALVFFGAASLGLLLGLLGSFGPPRKIELRDDVARLPKSAFSPRVVEVPYDRIFRLEVHHLGRLRSLHIRHVAGKNVLTSMALGDPKAFEQIVHVLSRKSCVAPQVVRVA